ncbi:uncharacterized protein ALTATR162_LOCUS7485 [Alternaria atra]|uniref:Uncharacterized protein n=1 Tax=Alternaria atra TaxID=119953 RepID=A0A8J2IDD6_9PLEO|nr:uncharacterized protein ALTATR162_LOCUS7485 [Alternaria atra]CAG5172516.1 unnamed protein product [Alternaria atra]
MERPCHHSYTQAPNLSPSLSQSVCAVCFTEARIAEVKAVQAALTRRGGIFGSSNAGPDWCSTDGDVKKWMNHRDWTRQWRRTRLDCWRLVAKLEKLQDEKSDLVEEWGVDEALDLWERAKEECSQVPGFQHVEDSASTAEEEMPKSHNTQAVSEPAQTEENPSKGDWETVKRRWKKRSQPLKSSHQDDFKQEDTGKVTLKEMKGVTNRLKDLEFALGNRFEAHAKDNKYTSAVLIEPTENPRRIPRGEGTPVESDSLPETATGKPRSALKWNSLSSPHFPKSVSIDAQAAIFPLNTTPTTTTPHHEHTMAEKSQTLGRLLISSKKKFAASREDSEEKDEVLTGNAEKAAVDQGKETEKGGEGQSQFRDSWRDPRLFYMRDWFTKVLTRDGNTPPLSRSHQEELTWDLKECNRALAQAEGVKEWRDAESER